MKLSEIQPRHWSKPLAAAALAALLAGPVLARDETPAIPPAQLTYADLVDLADSSKMVVTAQIRKTRPLAPEQSPGLRQGWVRLLVEADTQALVSGKAPIGQALRFLADFKLDANGKPPRLKKTSLILFALPVAGHPGDLQLVDVDSYVLAEPEIGQRVRDVLTQLAAPDGPPAVTGVRDALAVAGNLSGESETQIFLKTANDAPVSLNVVRRPNMDPEWGVSWSELVDQSAQPPQKDTLQWYRLACFLPRQLPPGAILSGSGSDKMLASTDYRYVLDQLGSCARTRGGPPKF